VVVGICMEGAVVAVEVEGAAVVEEETLVDTQPASPG
jgi:hypothetical protein